MLQQTSLRSKILKGIFALILFIILILAIVYISNNKKSKSAGNITVIVNNIDNAIVSQKRIGYNEGDSLYDVISRNYDLTLDETVYGRYILGIKGENFNIITKGNTESWIWLEVAYLKDNKEYSDDINFDDYNQIDVNKGIDGIELIDNMIFAMNERDNEHESSIFNQDINISSNISNDFKEIFKIIIIILCAILGIGIIIYIIYKINKSNAKITVKELCILSFLTAILFIQEQLLSFIPNVQFTFMLISLYTVVLGFKKTSIIIFVHVILDNMIMSSLNPIVMIPMLIGYEILALLVYLVKDKGLVIITIMASLGSIIYCLCFLIANSIFLDINILAYLIADIPFEIILVISTIITMMYVYKPVEAVLKSKWDEDTQV